MGQFLDQIIEQIQHLSPVVAILLLTIGMVLESTCFPVPSEAVLPIGGWMIAEGKFGTSWQGFVVVTTAIIAGSMLGSWLSYVIGERGGRRFIERIGRFALIGSGHFKQAERWIGERGAWAIFLGRLMFGVRHLQSLVAGALRMPIHGFLLHTLAGCSLWNGLGIYLGYRYGRAITNILRRASLGVLIAVVIAVLLLWSVVQVRANKTAADSKSSRQA